MIISSECSVDNPKIVTLLIDESFWKKIDLTLFKKVPKFPSHLSSKKEMEDFFFELEVRHAYNFILKKLSRKTYYSQEIVQLLKECLISEQAIQQVLKKCIDYQFINDQVWIKNFIRKEALNKHGELLIAYKLRQKKIPEDQIRSFLNEIQEEISPKQQIFKILQTKYKNRDLKNFKERQKIVTALNRRGYDFRLIKEVLLNRDTSFADCFSDLDL